MMKVLFAGLFGPGEDKRNGRPVDDGGEHLDTRGLRKLEKIKHK